MEWGLKRVLPRPHGSCVLDADGSRITASHQRLQIHPNQLSLTENVQLGQLVPPLCIERVGNFAKTHIVACTTRMCILANIGMFCQHKWVVHADLLNQIIFVMVCDWFGVEILPMVWNGPLHKNYRGRMERVLPMQTVVTLGSIITPKAPNPSNTTLNDLKWFFCAIGAVGTPFVRRHGGGFC
jgi:hypothetical protein